MCLPGLSIFAFPIGIKKSGDIASCDMGNERPYIISFSKTTTLTDDTRQNRKFLTMNKYYFEWTYPDLDL